MSKTAEPPQVGTAAVSAAEGRSLVESFAALGVSLDLNRTADQVLAGLKPLFRFENASIFVKALGDGGEIVCQRTRGEGEPDRDRPQIGRAHV